MTIPYDKYYQTENLFGEPYPDLIAFFAAHPTKGKVLDLGCGQGRDAIALARLGYKVTGIDHSAVGIAQMKQIAENENLHLHGEIADIYAFERFGDFDIILLDSMFHFTKKDKTRETALIRKIISEIKPGSLAVFCIQDTGDKVQVLNRAIDSEKRRKRLAEKSFRYVFEESGTDHRSETDYQMIVIEK